MKLFLAVKAGFFSKIRFCQSRFQVTIFPFKFVKRNPPPQNFLLLPFFVFSPFWRFCSLLGPCALFRLLRFCLSVPAKPYSTGAARFQVLVAGPMTLHKSFVQGVVERGLWHVFGQPLLASLKLGIFYVRHGGR